MSQRLRLLATGALGLSLASRPLGAQGITSAALQGNVVQVDGTRIEGAVVSVTSTASGAHWQVVTDAAGRYFLENVEVGGPYVIAARAVGFRPATRNGVLFGLGQRYRADFALQPTVVELPELTVRADVDPLLGSGRNGPARIVLEEELAGLPNLSRDLNVVAALSPLAAVRPLGGISIGGQNQGFNSFQVDGGVNADLYLGRSPGGASPNAAFPEVLPRAVSLETVREFQVLAAPFDVRLGNFAGGLLNAVTRSGTNDYHGSVFSFLQDGSLVAKDADGYRPDFTTWQFGGTLSGPILRDRVHFFLNADLQQRAVPDPGPLVTDTVGGADTLRTGVSYANALRFQQILRNTYGLEPGSLGPSDGHLPAQDLFAKVTVQLGASGHLELSQHHAHADRRDFIDVGRGCVPPCTYALSSVAGRSLSTAQTSRLIWSTLVGGRSQNELILSYERLRDSCQPSATLPRIRVAANRGFLLAGPNAVCPTTGVDQDGMEMTENLTVGAGPHVVTVGTHAELWHFRDAQLTGSAGTWRFNSLNLLEQGTASHYDRGLPGSAPPVNDFRATGLGVYVQDRWAPTGRLTVTAGLRLDVPFLPDAAATNPKLAASAIGGDTGRLPNGDPLWSPRLSLNYDLSGEGVAFLRGGIGLFSGPPPYRWLGNSYRDNGDGAVVICDGTDVPPFDPINQPSTCRSGGGTSSRVGFFDAGLKAPQNLKLSLGIDRRLPWGATATIDFLFTRAVHQLYFSEANLRALGAASGEGGRVMYGTIDSAGGGHQAWRDTAFGGVYRVSNRDGDRSLSVSAQARKRFGEGLTVYASYAYSRAQDLMSALNFPTRANFANTPLDGTLDERRLRPSFFETPHKISVAATFSLPFRVRVSLLYQGASQPPYTYAVDGDANADGVGGPSAQLWNDIAYVPRVAAPGGDISLVVKDSLGKNLVPAPASEYTRLEDFIGQQACLREQRGRIMDRNSCRNGWLGSLNARLSTSVPLGGGRYFEVIADVFNLPNLISSRWGRSLDRTTDPSVLLLKLVGWDAANARGIYQLELPARGVEDVASRWRTQLSARYVF